MKDIFRFNNDVLNSRDMQEEIIEIGSDIEKIVKYANEKGYDFDVETVKKYIENNSELTDVDLKKVSGGEELTVIPRPTIREKVIFGR